MPTSPGKHFQYIQNRTAYKNLETILDDLNDSIENEFCNSDDDTCINMVANMLTSQEACQNELDMLDAERLEASQKKYTPLDAVFKSSKKNLEQVMQQANDYKINAERAAKLIEIIGKFVLLL
ncbi:MAG: hypothetical protein GY748_23945 [Planctomycetaceae bacterium]|nr:hypothetical protein [Planctomycetaceae bacterium]